MLYNFIPYRPPIKIVREGDFKPWSINPTFKSFEINQGDWKDFIIISPCRHENYECPLLFKLKLHCQKNNIKLISFGTKNFFPLYAMYSDEVVLSNDTPNSSWYKEHDGSSNKIDASAVLDLPQYCELTADQMGHWNSPVAFKHQKSLALKALPEEIAKKSAFAPIYLREESVDKFEQIQESLPKNIIVTEIKNDIPLSIHLKTTPNDLGLLGIHQNFQIGLQNKVGKDNYLTTQILGSHKLNWSYVCVGGSANLFSVVPIQTVFMLDWLLDINEIKSFAATRYGSCKMPVVFRKNQFELDTIEDWKNNLSTVRWAVKQFSKLHCS